MLYSPQDRKMHYFVVYHYHLFFYLCFITISLLPLGMMSYHLGKGGWPYSLDGRFPSCKLCVTEYWGWLVTILGIVGDHTWDGWWIFCRLCVEVTLGWFVTILEMVGDHTFLHILNSHTGDGLTILGGKWVTILRMVGEYSADCVRKSHWDDLWPSWRWWVTILFFTF